MDFIKKNKEWIFIILITLSYAFFSFYHLGSFTNPNTFLEGKEAIYEVKDRNIVSKIRYFTGHNFNHLKIYTSIDNQNYQLLQEIDDKYVFSWNDIDVNTFFNYIKVEMDEQTVLGEIALFDERGNLIPLNAMEEENTTLIDEQGIVPEKISFYNSSYFDEVYFARSSYEYANHLPVFEWSHPPLAKLLSAIPIKLFHMAPFYYRFMGNLAAVLMIPLIFLFAKKMFKKTRYGIIASLLLVFDNFHYTQGRMGTMDSILALFILSSFYFMYLFLCTNEKDSLKKKLKYLFFSGLFVGCAIATKWTGFFAGLALCIVFFIHFFKHYRVNRKITAQGKKIFVSCIFFFGINILILYLMCYFCYPNFYYFHVGNIQEFIEITKQMYGYHSQLTDTHAFFSNWYTWPLMLKPVWYYISIEGNLKSSISGIGNPIIWWSGTISLFFVLYKVFKKDKNAFYLFIFYLCMLLPYMNISRGMFLYHYYPAFLITILALTYFIQIIYEKIPKRYLLIGYFVIIIFFFIYFFPISSGISVEAEYIEKLRWFSSWVF